MGGAAGEDGVRLGVVAASSPASPGWLAYPVASASCSEARVAVSSTSCSCVNDSMIVLTGSS